MRTRIRRTAAAVLTASALCLAGTACGAEDDKKPSASKSGDAKGSANDEPAEESKSVEPLTEAQMKASTLELGDLPSGWSVRKVPASADAPPKADKPECQPLADMLAAVQGATVGGDVDFIQAGGTIELAQQVFTLPGTGAADYVESVGTAVKSCTTMSIDMEGAKVPVKVAPLDAPDIAEASQTFTMAMEFAPGVEIKASVVTAHQGTGATRAVFKHAGGDKVQKAFPDLVTRVGDKLVKGAQG